LTDKEKKEFDWMDQEKQQSADFVRYKGWVYYINDFMACPKGNEMEGWDGYEADSYFSGILLKWPDKFDMDRVIMARIYS
jgi:hypothetical protein